MRVGLTTFLSKGAVTPTLDTLKPGMEVYQTGSSNKDAYRIATGKLTAFAGIATGAMGIVNAGIGILLHQVVMDLLELQSLI